MSLSREDMLRELELLPVWQARQQPTPAIAVPHEVSAEAAMQPQPVSAPPELLQPTPEALPGHGRAESVMQMDWLALQQSVAGCVACYLSKARAQPVFGAGDQNADWLIVGEAPSPEEDLAGEPLAGQVGELLNNMLAAISLKCGQNVYVTNALKCLSSASSELNKEAVEQCEPYLKRQIALIKPKLILVLGESAAQSLLRSVSAITAMRGKLLDYEGVPVIVTYDPAYLLRNPADKALAWEDLCLAKNTMMLLQSSQIPQS